MIGSGALTDQPVWTIVLVRTHYYESTLMLTRPIANHRMRRVVASVAVLLLVVFAAHGVEHHAGDEFDSHSSGHCAVCQSGAAQGIVLPASIDTESLCPAAPLLEIGEVELVRLDPKSVPSSPRSPPGALS